MKLTYPQYYQDFRCIASACEDSCCKEWEVVVDPQTASAYRQLPGALGNRLRQVLRQEEDCTLMTIENGRCPMWRQDGLCEIQAQHGHDALCQTCRDFPRIRHEYGTFTELGLELSCPEAARLIFYGNPQTVTEQLPDGESADYDPQVMEILLHSRRTITDYFHCSSHSLPQKLTVLLLYAHDVQAQIDGGEPAVLAPEQALADAERLATNGNLEVLIEYYVNLEILTDRWKKRLHSPAFPSDWDPLLIRFLHYAIERYWLQAVSDYDLVCRVKFILSACILMHALGGDTVQTAQLFSKEIENDPDNVDSLLDAAYTHPAFTDLNLLSLLQ